MKYKILIVGGSGFIGCSITNLCVDYGFSCYVLSLTGFGNDRTEGVEYIQADITDELQIYNALKGLSFEYVINLGGYIDHSPLFSDGLKTIDVHFNGLLNILKIIDKSALKRFVQIGSSDEYGRQRSPQNESMREMPISAYSVAKTSSTQLLQMLHRTEGFPVVILRLFIVYGNGQDKKRFLPQVIHGCLSNEEFPTSFGGQIRDFCHVSDIAHGILKALLSDAALGEIINLGSGCPISIRSVIEKVQILTGGGKPIFGLIPYRPEENMDLCADINKAKALLDWHPCISIDEGLERTIKDYLR
jgi:nucleoside-diphosphate-sugar epimerase